MRPKALLIATLIIGTMAFQFRQNVMPVLIHSALSATSTTAGVVALALINQPTSYDVRVKPLVCNYSLLARGFTHIQWDEKACAGAG